MNDITVRPARPEDVRPALALALRVFIEFEAPVYAPEAVDNFKADCIENESYIGNDISGRHAMFVAYDSSKLVGMVCEKDSNHISILMVDGAYHRQGIATALMDAIIGAMAPARITVNSSPYALPFYSGYGFAPTGAEQKLNGFLFTPMSYERGITP